MLGELEIMMIGRAMRRAALPLALLSATFLGGCYAYPPGYYGAYTGYTGYSAAYPYAYGYPGYLGSGVLVGGWGGGYYGGWGYGGGYWNHGWGYGGHWGGWGGGGWGGHGWGGGGGFHGTGARSGLGNPGSWHH